MSKENPNILLIGDYCEDRLVLLKCDRLSPEMAIPVAKIIEEVSSPGMAGNVLNNLRSICPTCNVVFLTQDEEIIKTKYVEKSSNHQFIRIDKEANSKPATISSILKFISKDLDAVVISDYNKGYLTESVMQDIFELCFRLGIPTFVDSKKKSGNWSSLATWVKINNSEFQKSPEWEKYCQNLIVTKGEEGSYYYNHLADSELFIPATKVAVSDLAGAGDTYFAAFIIKYIQTDDIEISMKFANYAAGIAVSKRGTYAVSCDDLVCFGKYLNEQI